MADYYNDLGISKNASSTEIKKAYKRIAQKNHPDKNPWNKSAEDKFKQASEAYEVLWDTQKRQQYDQFWQTANWWGGFWGGWGGFWGGFSAEDFDFSSFGDVFESFFWWGERQSSRRTRNTRGNDLETSINLTFEQSVKWIQKELKITKQEKCSHCHWDWGKDKKTCSTCHWSGQVIGEQHTPLWVMRVQRTCTSCKWEWTTFESKCSYCHGQWRIRESSKITVKIPGWIQDGSTMKVSSKGDVWIQNGTSWDLYLHINISSSKEFIRKWQDIFTEQKIHFLQALFWDEINIKTVHGAIKFKVPSWTQSDKMFRIKNYWMPVPHSEQKGNHYITIIVEIPTKLSKKEKELYSELAKESGLKITPQDDWFFWKMFG